MQHRFFKVAGHTFKVCLDGFLPAELSAKQERVALRLKNGESVGIMPVSAEDTLTWLRNSALLFKHKTGMFNFFPYAPFECDEGPVMMTFTLRPGTLRPGDGWIVHSRYSSP